MNTVLDDNKKLCLVSGEIIQLSAQMTMMFEVRGAFVSGQPILIKCRLRCSLQYTLSPHLVRNPRRRTSLARGCCFGTGLLAAQGVSPPHPSHFPHTFPHP